MDRLSLSDSDTDTEGKNVFKINKKYAKHYVGWRKKEEKQKLIDRYGNVSSDSEESDEGEINTTPQMDKDWLRAYAVVRFQQSRLYKDGEQFFHDSAKPKVKEKSSKVTLKDHERNMILEKGGALSDDETSAPKKPKGKTYVEEQEEIKQSFKAALQDSGDDSDGEGNELLVKKIKTEEEQKEEENDYLAWLKGEKEQLGDEEAEAELAPLKAYWNDPTLSEKEKVLRDYIFNNGYKDMEDSDDDFDADEGPDHSEEEEFLKKADEYEQQYNFRHEEPGGTEIKSYPRVIETSMRTKDTKRAEQRQRKQLKREQKRAEEKDEIRLLQRLQREEKEEKLKKLRDVSMNAALHYDLDADFDPDEHSKIMEKYFNEEYYGHEEAAFKKPEFDHDKIDDDQDDWWQMRDHYQKELSKTDGCEENAQNDEKTEEFEDEANFNMDADYDPTVDQPAKKKGKKEKKLSKSAKKKIPKFDPSKRSFDEYIDEYLKDKLQTLPFTYRQVVPNSFGLSTEEILTAKEKELNAWASVKKMSSYRTMQEEQSDVWTYQQKGNNLKKKFDMIPSLLEQSDEEETTKKKKRKRKKKKKEPAPEEISNNESEDNVQNEEIVDKNSAKKRKRQPEDSEGSCMKESPSRKKQKKQLAKLSETEKHTGAEREEQSPSKKTQKKQRAKLSETEKETEAERGEEEEKIKRNSKTSGDETKLVKNGEAKLENKKRRRKNKKTTDHVSIKMQSLGGNQMTDVKMDTDNDRTQKTTQKKKKKKKSIFIETKNPVTPKKKLVSKKQLERDLKQFMTSSRLSMFGIGASLETSNRKVKEKKMNRKKGKT